MTLVTHGGFSGVVWLTLTRRSDKRPRSISPVNRIVATAETPHNNALNFELTTYASFIQEKGKGDESVWMQGMFLRLILACKWRQRQGQLLQELDLCPTLMYRQGYLR